MTFFNITNLNDVTTIVTNTINMLYTNFFKVISSPGFAPRLLLPNYWLNKPCLLLLTEMVFSRRTSGGHSSTIG